MANENVVSAEGGANAQAADLTPIFNYLQSQPGHEVITRVLALIEDVKRNTLEKNTTHAMFGMWLQGGIVLTVVIATSILTYLGKFEPSVAVLFGLLVGYVFGRR